MRPMLCLLSSLLKDVLTKLTLILILIYSPQVKTNAQIIGPDTICYNQDYVYSVDEFLIASWTYTINPDNSLFSANFDPFEPSYLVLSSSSSIDEPTIIEITAIEWSEQEVFTKVVVVLPTFEDRLVFPYDICDEDGPGVFLESLEHLYSDKYVCLGDTTNIAVSYFPGSNMFSQSPPTQVFTPDRLQYGNGEIIAYDDQEVQLVWNVLGRQELILTTDGAPCPSAEFKVAVNVLDKTSIPIISDAGVNVNVQACRYENVHLEAGTSSTFTKWILSDGRIIYDSTVDISFDEAGVYEIELVDESECSCIEPSKITITIDAGPTPNIECTGTVCEDTEVYYYSSDLCDTYLWSVSASGLITEGGGPDDYFIRVLWNTAPSGEVTLETPGCFTNPCSESVTKLIPIIGASIPISGAQEVCYGEIATYSTFAYEGTEYNWDVSAQGIIVQGEGTNRIVVEWGHPELQDSLATISLDYNNCNLECGGSSSYDVTLLPPLIIACNSNRLCKNSLLTCAMDYGISVDWEIINPLGQLITINNTNSISQTLREIGVYDIRVYDNYNRSCENNLEYSLEVLPEPSMPLDLEELTPVCQGVSSIYTIPNLGNFDQVHWAVFDGNVSSPTLETNSKALTYEWTSLGPYKIEAYIENTLTGCTGMIASFILENDQELLGEEKLCYGDLGSYYLNSSASQRVDWQIIPPTAGSIISNDTDSIEVLWTGAGNFKIEARTCNVNLELDIEILPELMLSLQYPPGCPTAINQLTGTASGHTTIRIFDSNQAVVGTALPATLDEGLYTIELANELGCSISEAFEIQYLSVPVVRVSSPDPNVYCTISSPITLEVDTDGTLMFEWFAGNTSLGLTGSAITVSDFGSYHVIVTDSNGCTSRSNTHRIVQSCPGQTGSIELVYFSHQRFECDSLDFEMDLPYNSTSFQWNFDDPESGSENIKVGLKVTHEFTHAGYYYVEAFGNMNGEYASDLIRIPVVADFQDIMGCENELLQFNNTTTYIDGFDDSNYSWDFGDPMSGADNVSNLENPTHRYTSPGDYLVKLTSIDKDGCVSTVRKIVTIHPQPQLPMYTVIDDCISFNKHFELIPASSLDSYTWTVDDPQSSNTVKRGAFAFHRFSAPGNYPVTLTVRNAMGCTLEENFVVNVEATSLSGFITSAASFPKCPEDIVMLSAPGGATSYAWSNGESTSTINVIDDGIYKVTMTDQDGCEYIPPAFQVLSIALYEPVIFGVKDGAGLGEQRIHLDSLEVCQGDIFSVMINDIDDVDITWSNGKKEFQLSYLDNFIFLSPGRYTFSVDVNHLVSGCSLSNGPFVVIIHDNPRRPNIESDRNASCEGELHTISITNKVPGLRYQWQDGSIQESFVTDIAGNYFVRAINEHGCFSESRHLNILSLPTALGWMSGCREVCFPSETCLLLDDINDFKLLKDGSAIQVLNPINQTLIIDEPGDYSLEVTNSEGCVTVTDVLSLSALSLDQQVSGVVFLDANQNGVFDGSDELLAGIAVQLNSGTTIVATTATDQNGAYIFEEFPGVSHHLSLDLSGTDYEFLGAVDSLISFESCIEDEELDFPLITNCRNVELKVDTFVCPGGMISFNGKQYSEFATDTFLYDIALNCDSTLILEVFPYPEPQLNWTVSNTCVSEANGVLEILFADSLLQFGIDGGTRFSDTYIDGLAAGDHTLEVYDLFSCKFPIEFRIEEFLEPQLALMTELNCDTVAGGALTIEVLQGDQLEFSIDGGTRFSDTYFAGLSSGDHTLYVYDTTNCTKPIDFNIAAFIEPLINVTTESSCDASEGGAITIEIIRGEPLEFSLDGDSIFSPDLNYNDLADGEHVLLIKDENGCTFESPFDITPLVEPQFTIEPNSSCELQNTGSLRIDIEVGQVQFALDNTVDFSDTLFYDVLSSGTYTLYSKSGDGCLDSLSFTIENFDEPNIDIAIKPNCEMSSLGQLLITTSDPSLYYSLNGLDYTGETQIDSLEEGDYTLYYRTDNDCIFETAFTIETIPAPVINITTSPSCKEDKNGRATLEVIEGEGLTFSLDGLRYDDNMQFDNLESADYILYVLNEADCLFEFPFSVIEAAGPLVDARKEDSCPNIDNGKIVVLSANSSDLIMLNNGAPSLETVYDNLEPGIYTISIIDSLQCSNQLDVEVIAQPELIVEIPEFQSECNDVPITIAPFISSSAGPVEYLWSDGTTQPTYTTFEDGYYELLLKDDCQEQSFSWDLQFAKTVHNHFIYVPNVISEHAQDNDCFKIGFHPDLEIISYSILIFDRWGNKMYESVDTEACWDGWYRGMRVVQGVYVYVINTKVLECDGIYDLKRVGDLTVFR